MSETVRNDVSIESICTVIENTPEKKESNSKKLITNGDCHKGAQINNNDIHVNNNSCSENETSLCSSISEYSFKENGNGDSSTDVNCDTTTVSTDSKQLDNCQKKQKIKKSVSFDPNDEKVRKFISGDPIVDQKNPFKNSTLNNGSLINGQSNKKKKTPPPIPTKRSTLSICKTVTQQLREREREKEKEKERLKNETNNRKSNLSNGSAKLPSPDDFITTEEVLRQSKYVKTYIKNPDPVFVYDPTILARLKLEELRELSEKKPPKKLKLANQSKERIKELKKKSPINPISPSSLPFKKCSKPNYPELSDIKVKVGTDSDGEFFNPAEVTKNAKKFDERVKKLHIGLEDDLDDIEEPLTKSESSDEVPLSDNNTEVHNINASTDTTDGMSTANEDKQPLKGTFTNTIKSKEFQEYLDKKGLSLIPKKIPYGAQSLYTPDGLTKKQAHISFKAPDSIQITIDNMESPQNQGKKLSVFQRLLANSIFASRRKTTPKEPVPSPRSLNDFNAKCKENGVGHNQTSPLKRVVLERQSYHGKSRASNLLSAAEALDLRQQMERSRRSYANGGDDISISISSALTNAEYMDPSESKQVNNCAAPVLRKTEAQTKPLTKPPRRTLSRDRLNSSQQQQNKQPVQESVIKPRNLSSNAQSKENIAKARELSNEAVLFRRSLERSSMMPKRISQSANTTERRQMFGRSTSMDRNEILKRSANRGLYNRTISACETIKSPTNSSILTKEDEFMAQFNGQNGPKLTSTPVKNSSSNLVISPKPSPMSNALSPSKPYSSGVYVDLQEWERLRAFKERTDKELYFKVLQQQQQQQHHQQQRLQQQHRIENIYERLPTSSSQAIVHPEPQYLSQIPSQNQFLRGSPQRNTFSGLTRGHRNAKIIDGKALLAIEQAQEIQVLPINGNKWGTDQSPTVRCQSALDGVTTNHSNKNFMRRGYESDNETPVILRRRQVLNNDAVSVVETGDQPRRIGGILTREEILQKVKEFCRKSMNKTPTMQAIYEKQPLNTDISPVSYVSVETHQRPLSRMYAAPQVPQRMHSLPQRFVPIIQEARAESDNTNPSPIYAHVIKRSSLQSNQSVDLYDTPQQQQRQVVPNQTTYITRNTLTRPENHVTPVQYVILDSEQITPHQLVEYQPQLAAAGQDVYIRVPTQSVPGSYGYIAARDTQTIRPRLLHDGRSTPLILDRSSQQASQIYWTPQHQRLQQQHTGLMPVQISPRYTSKQPATYAMVPTTNNQRTVRINPHTQQYYNIPSNAIYSTLNNKQIAMQQVILTQQQQQQQKQQQYLHYSPQQPHQQQNLQEQEESKTVNECHAQNHYEWESGSEGEVQRIMEQQRKSGELKSSNILANLKLKLARFWPNSQR